jgi:hypothetical protein
MAAGRVNRIGSAAAMRVARVRVTVVGMVEVRGFVGQHDPAFLRDKCVQHSSGDHDPAVVLVAGGDGERLEVGLVDDDEASVSELPAFLPYVV